MHQEMKQTLYDEVTGEEELCTVTYYIDPYVAAKTYGEADKWSEEEGGFVYDTEVINSKGENITETISSKKMARIEEDCFSHAENEASSNEPDEDYYKDTGND